MSKLRAFLVSAPERSEPTVVAAENHGKAQYLLFKHFRALGYHQFGCGLAQYRLIDFVAHRAHDYEWLAYNARHPRIWQRSDADLELSLRRR